MTAEATHVLSFYRIYFFVFFHSMATRRKKYNFTLKHKGEKNLFFLRGWWVAGGREKRREENVLLQT